MNKQDSKALAEWANTWRGEHLTPAVEKLITQATFDLLYGPNTVDDTTDETSDWYGWPGFTSACAEITRALADMPRTLYIDTQAGFATDVKPTFDDPEFPEDEQDWLELDAPAIRKALVGSYLEEYVR